MDLPTVRRQLARPGRAWRRVRIGPRPVLRRVTPGYVCAAHRRPVRPASPHPRVPTPTPSDDSHASRRPAI